MTSRTRRVRTAIGASGLAVIVGAGTAFGAAASASASSSSTAMSAVAATATAATPPAAPPSGGSGGSGGSAQGGSGSSSAVVGTGSYTQKSGSATKSGTTITASTQDESGVLVKGGSLTLNRVKVSTTGKSSSSDDSSFYGLDAGVLALAGATITETGGSVTTTGDGANAVFAYGSGASISISKTKISATGQYAHGIMASGGGAITATDLSVSTTGASGAAVATDRGGGTIKVVGGSYRTSGQNSPGIYSTGSITASGATFVATGAEAVVVEGSNSVTVLNSALTGEKNRGVMIYQSFSGDASGSTGRFTETGGSLTATDGPLFFVTNSNAVIHLKSVKLSVSSGTLLDAEASSWGTSGANGGHAKLVASHQTLKGSIVADKISTVSLKLTNSSKYTGAIDTANTAKSITVSLDSSSTWTVTADSYVSVLSDAAGISGSTITNIVGNGHTVYYDSSANPTLDGKTYTLVGGGTLTPA
jgi:hypothetical protein